MFRIIEHDWVLGKFTIRNGENGAFLHSDDSIFETCPEWWPTRELAQAVLDKYQPSFVWKHGDVFENICGKQIYLEPYNGPIVVNLECTHSSGTPEIQLSGKDTVFLFNIKDNL